MNNNKIKLPDFIIADLYKDSLVRIDNENLVPEKKENQPVTNPIHTNELPLQAQLKYMGENKKHVTVLVNEPNHPYLPEEDLDLLTKILSACNLNLGDISIINTANQTVHFDVLKEQLSPKVTLLFNVPTISVKLPFTIPDFQIQPFDNCTFLSAPSLHELNHSADARTLKGNLWTKLKQLFSA